MIYKYRMETQATFQVEMPLEMEPLHIGLQDGTVYLWANVNLDSKTVKRIFHCVGTGMRPPEGKQYLGTVVISTTDVRHFFSEQAPLPLRYK